LNERSGIYRDNLSGKLAYRSFVPATLPPIPPIENNDTLINLVGEANRVLGVLDTSGKFMPGLNNFIYMYTLKEALLSSQIEGTQATFDDVLNPNANENNSQDIKEVFNYLKANEYAYGKLRELPLCNRLIRETHKVLLSGVRGQEKDPGYFRESQNWIGGTSIKNAKFIPPNHEDMLFALDDFEKYIHNNDDVDPLIKISLIHYQFETIHPFLDGNGRMGRLLVNLFLTENELLNFPTLYISCYLKQNRQEYYDRLMEVREKGDYEQWVLFFLRAISESGKDAINSMDEIFTLLNEDREKLNKKIRKSKLILDLHEYLLDSPIITAQNVAKNLKISYNTALTAIKSLIDSNILITTGKEGKTPYYMYKNYVNIFRKDT